MSKIEWTDKTWNPVWGCENNCSYCYARQIAKRFWKKIAKREYPGGRYYDGKPSYGYRLKNFIPTWIESNFVRKFPKKPTKIFVDSMSDIAFWKPEWMGNVLYRIKKHPQHIFQFLTKQPEVYLRYNFPKNCWKGATVTKTKDMFDPQFFPRLGLSPPHIRFISIEPIMEKIDLRYLHLGYIDWVIIGAETGNRKGKIIPEREWIEDIVQYCQVNEIPVFMKDNLQNYWLENLVGKNLIQEFPEATHE